MDFGEIGWQGGKTTIPIMQHGMIKSCKLLLYCSVFCHGIVSVGKSCVMLLSDATVRLVYVFDFKK